MDTFIPNKTHSTTTAAIPQRTAQQTFLLILILGLLDTLTPFSIDMYLPAFPPIAKDLHTTVENMSLSVSTYFMGFAIGQIIYGPLLDRFGRKLPLYIGLVLYIFATLGCAACQSLNALLIMRFVQALGGCVGSVAAIAMVQDLFPPEKSASIISFLILVIGLSPLLAPSVGSFVLSLWGWHGVFVVLTVIAAILLLIAFFFLPAGAPPDKSVSLMPKPILKVFRQIITEPQFYVYAFAGTFAFAPLFIYVAGSPAVFMNFFNLTPHQYGGVFALLSVGFIGGSQLNHWLTKRYSSAQIFTVALIIQTIASILFLAIVWMGALSLAGHLVFLFVILSCVGISGPNATAIAMSPFAKTAGSASALLGFIQIGIGGIVSSAVGLLHQKGSLPLTASMTASVVIALFIFLAGRRKFPSVKENAMSN